MTCKPHRKVFIIREILYPMCFYGVLALGVGWFGAKYFPDWAWLAAAGAWVVLAAFACLAGRARYRKTVYEVHADRIVVHGGGLVSDHEVEVHYPNITHVKWIRPWLFYKLFGVGWVTVEVAGGGAGSIAFHGIERSEEVQAEIRRHMGQVFSMSTDRLLHEEKPAGVGIFVDLIVRAAGAVIAFIFVGAGIFDRVRRVVEDRDWLSAVDFHPAWVLLILLAGLVALGLMALRFLDLKRRDYRVYDGVIEYHEGFLSRHDAFMPVENLSNSSISRRITERVTNLYNVVVSCQGAGQEVVFLYLRNGPALNQVLDGLIDASGPPATAAPPAAQAEVDGAAPEPHVDEAGVVADALPGGEVGGPEAIHRMHVVRSLVPMVLYFVVLLPLLIFAPMVLLLLVIQFGRRLIRVFRTTYRLRQNSVQESYQFVSMRNREFSNDKITGVVFRENLLDRIFDTISIEFWSIGDGKEIVFQNVKKSEPLVAAACARARIRMDGPVETIHPDFSGGRFASANLPLLALYVGLIAGVVAAAVIYHWTISLSLVVLIPLPLWGWICGYIYHSRASLSMHPDCMVFRRGILVRQKTCARYANIKDVTTLKFPGYDCGSMRFNVAGERVEEGSRGSASPYGFTMRYIPGIIRKSECFDHEVLARDAAQPTRTQEPIEARKAIGNTVVKTLLTGVIVFPLSVLLPVTLPLYVRWASLVRYRIEPGRVLMRKGKLYRRQTSILFDRIDHIQTRQGALNKLFKNGDILISTAGSSGAELILANVKGHEAFYAALREQHATKRNR